MPNPILSRHRLVQPYRLLLTVTWLIPMILLVFLLVLQSAAFLNPRLWLLLLMMALPALHIWQQGVDVGQQHLTVRMAIPRHFPYEVLRSWEIFHVPGGRMLQLTDETGEHVLQVYLVHLSDYPLLIDRLKYLVAMQEYDYVRR